MNIGIIGRARVGKDTAGEWFVNERGYRRVAFADPLKEAALRLDPIIWEDPCADVTARLAETVRRIGWERAKDAFPEVRRILQELGAAIRGLDEDFWLRQALKKTVEHNDAGVPVVITDVRYRNEAEALRRAGFHLVYIERPGVPELTHESEGALTDDDANSVIYNSGSIEAFLQDVEAVWNYVHALESARFACKF
ncbi:hypothetical protein ABZ352_35440 [Streptomyces griseofuscus]|uniref:deoxynucleotide monophosphate kinase family protein n=1 Tax=Streptomyces griseofuscus TaxID=146922 RepID=UPI0033D76D3F